jgi:putative N6-adenine-specific DNA methylase
MCGSGSLLAEALMRCCRIPAGYLRERFDFERLPDFEPATWRSVRQSADQAIRPLEKGLIAGSDIDAQAIRAARANLKRLPGGDQVALEVRSFQDLNGLENRTIVTNPPYGLRLGRADQIGPFVTEFGDFLKQRCKGSTAYVYFGKRELLKQVGLRSKWKKPLKNGQLDGRLARFDLY